MVDQLLDKVNRFSDDRYGNDNRLNARIQIYRYCENKTTLQEWIFDKLDFTGVSDVLDLGCGNGQIWRRNIRNIPKQIRITLSDISDGMVEAAGEALKDDGRFVFHTADAGNTPFQSSRYQMITANHMLYHVDKQRVFSEINRLMTDDGYGYASTPGESNFLELFGITDGFDKRLSFESDDIIQNFSLENGGDILSGSFDAVECFLYRNDVVTDDTDSLILYLASCFEPDQLEVLMGKWDEFRGYMESIIDKSGKLRITNKVGLFKFRKKK